MVPKYYAVTPVSRDKPSGLFRFFEDEERAPEYFKVGQGWVPDDELWLTLMSGELTDDDLVSEETARELVHSWGGTL